MPTLNDSKSKLRVDSPVFTPSKSITAESVNVPPFVPSGATAPYGNPSILDAASQNSVNMAPQAAFDAKAMIADNSIAPQYDPTINYYQQQNHMDPSASFVLPTQTTPDYTNLTQSLGRLSLGGSAGMTDMAPHPYYQAAQMDSYYYQSVQQQSLQMMTPPQPLQYHLYTTPLPHISNLHPHQKTIHAFFMSDKLREDLQRRSEAVWQILDPNNPEAQRLPQELHIYHSLYPLDDHKEKSTKVFGYPTWVYKVTSSVDGKPYILRRVEGFRLTNEAAMSSIEGWRRIRHANIVSVKEAFTTKGFGDNSLVFVYDYHPLATTLYAKHFLPSGHAPVGLPEKNLWSYITQLASALKTIHSAGLAARIIEPSKILVTGKNRIRLNCCGIFDMLTYDGGKTIPHYQQDDLLHFGQLIVALACGSLASVHNLPKSIEYISRQYSADLKNVVLYLLSKPSNYKTIDDVITMIGPRILHEINSAHHYNDLLENELTRELENGRLVRQLCKLGFINERPEFDMDPSWSETGDRYLLKLFRDYVFHQVDENGNPIVDMAHVMTCLNKLDSGVDEKIMLMSRDEQSCLIVSYKELKQCIETSKPAQAFQDGQRALESDVLHGRRQFQVKDTYSPRDLNERNLQDYLKAKEKKPKQDMFKMLKLDPLACYKDVGVLSHFVTELGMIKRGSETGSSIQNQRRLARAVKRAQAIGLMPYTYRIDPPEPTKKYK
ncbi:PAB-dependent poly(A)-specific ribonuclease subunit 3 [Quaeritorhiza haematococci]|nr:PAB-dependent poly(A)-specific ribonuclease subunit 3 [Quaeritorhiza haematococci]